MVTKREPQQELSEETGCLLVFIIWSVKPIGQLCCRWDASDLLFAHKVNKYSYSHNALSINSCIFVLDVTSL